jgi:hypothetical protein
MLTYMRQVLLALLCSVLVQTCFADEGLSFTNRNKDKLCGERPYCSDVQLRQTEKVARTESNFTVQQFNLRVLVTLYPNTDGGSNAVSIAPTVDDVKSVQVDVTLETRDKSRQDFRRIVPVKVQGKGASAVRYCELELNPNSEIVAVHAIDAREKDRKGNIIFQHQFR